MAMLAASNCIVYDLYLSLLAD